MESEGWESKQLEQSRLHSICLIKGIQGKQLILGCGTAASTTEEEAILIKKLEVECKCKFIRYPQA